MAGEGVRAAAHHSGRAHRYRVLRIGVAVALFAASQAALWVSFSPEEALLRVVFLDVGQGDAIFIEAPNGVQVLVDGGARASALMPALAAAMPWWDRSLDVVVATHPDKDHIGGLPEVAARYRIGLLLMGTDETVPFARALRDAAARAAIPRTIPSAGMRLWLDKTHGITLDILSPDAQIRAATADSNARSVVARLTFGSVDFLLMGDAPRWVERKLLWERRAPLEAEVLKVGHHGSRTSTAPEFLDAVAPAVAVISAGARNRYGHPHPETLAALKARGISVVSTAREGNITLATDGTRWWRE